jgi:hypothetical protein
VSVDHDVRMQLATVAQHDVLADHAVRADHAIQAEYCLRVNDG